MLKPGRKAKEGPHELLGGDHPRRAREGPAPHGVALRTEKGLVAILGQVAEQEVRTVSMMGLREAGGASGTSASSSDSIMTSVPLAWDRANSQLSPIGPCAGVRT